MQLQMEVDTGRTHHLISIRSDGENWEIVQGVPVNEFARGKTNASVNELAEERELVSNLLQAKFYIIKKSKYENYT